MSKQEFFLSKKVASSDKNQVSAMSDQKPAKSVLKKPRNDSASRTVKKVCPRITIDED